MTYNSAGSRPAGAALVFASHTGRGGQTSFVWHVRWHPLRYSRPWFTRLAQTALFARPLILPRLGLPRTGLDRGKTKQPPSDLAAALRPGTR